MAPPNGLTETLAGFARTLTSGYDVSDVLHDLTARITGVLGITGAGVSLRENGDLRFVTADHEDIAVLERVQEERQAGPCVEAMRTGQPLLIADLAGYAERWPDYVAAAARSSIVAVAAIPMRNSTAIGALDVYDTRPHEWDADEVSTARVFTDIATAYVLHASELQRERRTTEQLQRALESRIVIEQAKGIIAAERKVSIDQAFAVLRKHANDRNVTLRAVADAVVNLGLRP